MIFVFCSGQDGQNGGHFDYILSTLFISPPYMSNHRGYLSHLFDLFFSLAIYQSEKKCRTVQCQPIDKQKREKILVLY
jgi:hypothetical protein